ncbi:MAG: hypothetical protein ACJ700_01660, partial [Nitrososphaera sp.]
FCKLYLKAVELMEEQQDSISASKQHCRQASFIHSSTLATFFGGAKTGTFQTAYSRSTLTCFAIWKKIT